MKDTNLKFMLLNNKYSDNNSKFRLILLPFEGKVTFLKGTNKGCYEILKASENLEYYEDQFNCEPFLEGVKVFNCDKLKKISNEDKSFKIISEFIDLNKLIECDTSITYNKSVIKNEYNNKEHNHQKKFKNRGSKFNIFIGGDHSVSYPVINQYNKIYNLNKDKFDVIIFDAHSDLRDSWNDSSFNHACTTKNIVKDNKVLLVGVRSQDIDEVEFIENNNDKIDMIKSYDFDLKILKEKIKKLNKNVFISIDVDVFNPELIRNTGTPEPGGLSWEDIIKSLEICFKNKNIIGIDIVEFAPRYDYKIEAYFLAKLIYKIMAMKLKFN